MKFHILPQKHELNLNKRTWLCGSSKDLYLEEGRGEQFFMFIQGSEKSLNETMGSSNSFQFKFLSFLTDLFSSLSSFYTKLYL